MLTIMVMAVLRRVLMLNAVLVKDITQRWLPVTILGLVLAGITVGALAISAHLQDVLTSLAQSFPEALNAFIGADTPGGYVVGELFNVIAPLALVSYAVLTGASGIAGEEEEGTMDLLAAQPISRRKIFINKAISIILALAIAILLFGAAAVISAWVFGVNVSSAGIIATCTHMFFLVVMFGALALALGAATGYPSAAAAGIGVIAALSYLADVMLPLADLSSWARLSPWYYYAGSHPMLNGVNQGHISVLAIITTSALVLAAFIFERRDLTR